MADVVGELDGQRFADGLGLVVVEGFFVLRVVGRGFVGWAQRRRSYCPRRRWWWRDRRRRRRRDRAWGRRPRGPRAALPALLPTRE